MSPKVWFDYLNRAVDGAGLAVFRMLFGALLFADCLFYFASGRIYSKFIRPDFLFPFVPGLERLPGEGLYWVFAIMVAAAAFVAIGLFYRAAALILWLGLTYVFLIEKAQYLNHMYLICLISFLMLVVPANRVWSVDRKLGLVKGAETVPFWSVFLLRAQICIVYFYGGVVKLNPDWLAGQPQTSWMEAKADYPLVGPLIAHPLFAKFITFGGIAVDLSMPFLLNFRRTFWIAVTVGTAFHITNSFLFHIGVFPWFMIATLALFPPTDWPRRALSHSGRIIGGIIGGIVGSTIGKIGEIRGQAVAGGSTDAGDDALPSGGVPASAVATRTRTATFAIALVHVYLAMQLLIPFRHLLYSDDVAWNERGYYFSWRMMLHHKDVIFSMFATDPITRARKEVVPYEYLTVKQVERMRARPDMILQFAHHVAELEEKRTGHRPVINVRAIASLNKGPWYDLIDPQTDLAAQPLFSFQTPWILPRRAQSVAESAAASN